MRAKGEERPPAVAIEGNVRWRLSNAGGLLIPTEDGPVRRILVSNGKLSRQMRRANESAVIKNTIAGANQGRPSGRE